MKNKADAPQTPSAQIPPQAGGEGRDPGKRLFVGLVLGTGALICLVIAFLWMIPTLGFGAIHPSLPYITAAISVAVMLGIGWTTVSLIWHVRKAGRLPHSQRMRGLAIRLFLPLAELLGRFLGFSIEEVRRSFIKVNNELVLHSKLAPTPDKILILLPHCLQATVCPRRLTHNPENCIRCGQCVQGSLLDLRDVWGVHLAVATGGTIARRIVVQLRPQLIIAVACERDLSSGIQDTYPLPVYGVLNQRPHGPCLDTTLDLHCVEEALQYFIKPLQPKAE